MTLTERLAARCIGCRNGVHDPTRLYPCLTDAEWRRRESVIRSPFVRRALAGTLPPKEIVR